MTAALSVAVASGVTAPHAGAAAGNTPTAPLATTVPTTAGTFAVVAMGDVDYPSDTFWQLVFRTTGSTRWALVTPPGVADNGGLVVSSVGDTTTAAIVPSGGLRFSPLAQSTDNGRTWTASVLPDGVAPLPDALESPTDPGATWAIVDRGATAVETPRAGGPTRVVASSAALAQASAGSCSVEALTAIASTGGSSFAGSACASATRVPLFREGPTGWRIVGPTLRGAQPVTVLRLTAAVGAAGSLSAVILRGRSRDEAVQVVASANDGTDWRGSQALHLPPDARLLSVAPGPGGEWSVLWQQPGRHDPSGVVFDGAAWSPPVRAPLDTALLVAGPTSLDALTVDRSLLTDWRRVGGSWSRSSVLRVPVQYGSSH